MLVLGGTGRLYGALIGAAIFMSRRTRSPDLNPRLLAVLARRCCWSSWCCSRAAGILGGADALALARRCARRRRHDDARCAPRACASASARFAAVDDVIAELARRARGTR